MKKIMFFALLCIALIGCEASPEGKLHSRLCSKYANAEFVDSAGMRASKFSYEGHEYVTFFYKDGLSVVHNPECKKCYDLFD